MNVKVNILKLEPLPDTDVLSAKRKYVDKSPESGACTIASFSH